MEARDMTLVRGPNPKSDEGFQQLLLRFSSAAARGASAGALMELFCRETRALLQVSGVYFWRSLSPTELIGAEADGVMAERFRGQRMKASDSAAAAEAVRTRRAVVANSVDPTRFPMAAQYGAQSLMAAPLIVSNEVIGAVTFLHNKEEDFFTDDLSAKATILAGQLGSLLEARRLSDVSREDNRRAEILAEAAQALHGVPDMHAVVEGLADRIRVLLRTKLVCVLMRQEGPFELKAVSADGPQLASAARARPSCGDRPTSRWGGRRR